MTLLWWSWGIGAGALLLLGVWVGKSVRGHWGGVLVDDRGRYSLNRLQISLWSVTLLPLIAGVVLARSTEAGIDPLAFTLPPEVLGVLGIAVASATAATVIKVRKNRTRAPFIAAAAPGEERLVQCVLVEEGPNADQTVDISKLQSLVITVMLVLAYAVLTWHDYSGRGPAPAIQSPRDITTLPTFDKTFLLLLAVSHAGYLGAKIPNRGQFSAEGTPRYSLNDSSRDLAAARQKAVVDGAPAPTYPELYRAARERKAQALEEANRRAASTPAGDRTFRSPTPLHPDLDATESGDSQPLGGPHG